MDKHQIRGKKEMKVKREVGGWGKTGAKICHAISLVKAPRLGGGGGLMLLKKECVKIARLSPQRIINSYASLMLHIGTCRARGFHLMFFSKAGADVRVLWGRFFSVRVTPAGLLRKEFTRFFSCQPTYTSHIQNTCVNTSVIARQLTLSK